MGLRKVRNECDMMKTKVMKVLVMVDAETFSYKQDQNYGP